VLQSSFANWNRLGYNNSLGLGFHSECNRSHLKTWPHCSPYIKNNQKHQDFLPPKLEKTHFPVRFASARINNKLLTKHIRGVSQTKGKNKAIKNLNTKIPTDPYKIAIIPVRITYPLNNQGTFPNEWQYWI